ncbi:hypothetical protein B9T62_04030 [Paenibacillus donghaensis]|uniref:Sirohydrochlorin chelatase n=2 Tax=Paenibacillus donghaensis TaxID=414771 RepID=A0A2Z2KVA9_9BACL|nr:hypothetical protein B9T62_04030 [Paenibacillus donghaensis]
MRPKQQRKTVLLVGHGSRIEAGNEELRAFAAQLAARRPELKFETCFIELCRPSISEGIDNCIRSGAEAVYVVPIILFAAGHSKLDIPQAIDRAKQKYPGMRFIYGRPIGMHEHAAEILLDRIKQAVPLLPPDQGQQEPAGLPAKIADKDTVVLLMGRGGSDPDANSDFYKLTRLLWEKTPYQSVEACFIAITGPLLPEGLERCLKLQARRIIVLPYLLFTGVLMKQFAEAVAAFAAAHPEIAVEMGSYLGGHPLLAEILSKRIDETLSGQVAANCDLCKYRSEAAEHHHHEHEHDHGHHCQHDNGHGNHHHEHEHEHDHDHGHHGQHDNGHEYHHHEHDHDHGHHCQHDNGHGNHHHEHDHDHGHHHEEHHHNEQEHEHEHEAQHSHHERDQGKHEQHSHNDLGHHSHDDHRHEHEHGHRQHDHQDHHHHHAANQELSQGNDPTDQRENQAAASDQPAIPETPASSAGLR